MNRLGFIGAGNMGSALIRGLIRFGAIAPENVYVCGHHPEALREFQKEVGFVICETAQELIACCDTVLVAIKPYHIEAFLKEHGRALSGKLLLSVISGYDFDRYAPLLPSDTRHMYIMPNTPCGVGAGVFMFEEKQNLTPDEYAWVKDMFTHIGEVVTLPSHLMSIGSAVAGCGPAFIAMAIEALADSAVKYGIPRKLAYRLVSQMTLGTAKLQLETDQHPGVIKDGVCSPHGTTICGVEALERAGMRAAFMDAVDAVMDRG